MWVRQLGGSVLVIGVALIGGLVAMLIAGIVMVLGFPHTVLTSCVSGSWTAGGVTHRGPEVCTGSLSTFWEVLVTAGVMGATAVGIGIPMARHRHPIPFSN